MQWSLRYTSQLGWRQTAGNCLVKPSSKQVHYGNLQHSTNDIRHSMPKRMLLTWYIILLHMLYVTCDVLHCVFIFHLLLLWCILLICPALCVQINKFIIIIACHVGSSAHETGSADKLATTRKSEKYACVTNTHYSYLWASRVIDYERLIFNNSSAAVSWVKSTAFSKQRLCSLRKSASYISAFLFVFSV